MQGLGYESKKCEMNKNSNKPKELFFHIENYLRIYKITHKSSYYLNIQKKEYHSNSPIHNIDLTPQQVIIIRNNLSVLSMIIMQIQRYVKKNSSSSHSSSFSKTSMYLQIRIENSLRITRTTLRKIGL